jgi:hypothetical protein
VVMPRPVEVIPIFFSAFLRAILAVLKKARTPDGSTGTMRIEVLEAFLTCITKVAIPSAYEGPNYGFVKGEIHPTVACHLYARALLDWIKRLKDKPFPPSRTRSARAQASPPRTAAAPPRRLENRWAPTTATQSRGVSWNMLHPKDYLPGKRLVGLTGKQTKTLLEMRARTREAIQVAAQSARGGGCTRCRDETGAKKR